MRCAVRCARVGGTAPVGADGRTDVAVGCADSFALHEHPARERTVSSMIRNARDRMRGMEVPRGLGRTDGPSMRGCIRAGHLHRAGRQAYGHETDALARPRGSLSPLTRPAHDPRPNPRYDPADPGKYFSPYFYSDPNPHAPAQKPFTRPKHTLKP